MERYSAATGFHVDIVEKVYRLTLLLMEINGVPELSKKLVLKGGTAINFIYFNVPRLSIDIDMDYLGVAKENMIKDREKIRDILLRIFKKHGYKVIEKEEYALLQFTLGYKNTAGNMDRIKLEINFFNRVPVFQPVKKRFKNFFELKNFKVTTLVIEELFGRKLRALVTRGAPRDLYDVYKLFTSGIEINMEKLRKCFIFYLCCHSDPRKISLELVESIGQHSIKTDLLPLLRKGEKIDAEEMKKVVIPIIRDFMKFDENEIKYIEELYDRKNHKPELLFEGLNYNKELSEHPGIKWKIKGMKNGK